MTAHTTNTNLIWMVIIRQVAHGSYEGPYDPTTATATWDFFTSGYVLRMSRFLRRRCPFTRGRLEALFDVVRKRGN